MLDPATAYAKARHHALRACVRGDLDAAERWTKVMRDHLSCARKLGDLYNPRPIPKPKPPKRAPPPPSMPVMLDPKGFSPGGQPNWYLNQLRRERAGLK